MFSLFRSVYVFLRLLPFILSFARDFKGKILFGAPIERTDEDHAARARDLTRVLASLGPTFIKGPQVLATREDIIHPAYTHEFKKLQDKVPPFPVEQVHAIILREFARPAESLFEYFNPVPIAAASLGQVHRAKFRGKDIAFKVQRPGIERLVEADMAAIHFILTMFETFTDSHMVRSSRACYREFHRVITLEMDYRTESANAERLRRNMVPEPQIVIPLCFDELTTRFTVAFEFCDGCRVDNPEGVARAGLTPESLMQILSRAYLRMVLVDGYFHADPHPGNLIVMSGGRIAIVDYGMSVEIGPHLRLEMLRLFYYSVLEDVDGVVESFYRLKMVEPETNRGALCEAAETLMRIRLKTDATPRQIQEIAYEILQTFYRFPLRLPDQLVYLARAAALVEGIGYVHDPAFNAVKFTTPIVKELLRDQDFIGQKPLKDRLKNGAKQLRSVAQELRRSIKRFDRDEMRFRYHEADITMLESLLGAAVRRLLGGIAAVSLALGGVVVYLETRKMIWLIACLIPAAIVLFFAALLPLHGRQRRRGKRNPFL